MLDKLLGATVLLGVVLTGGADDFISNMGTRDFFVGAGFRLMDDDIKTIARYASPGSLIKK